MSVRQLPITELPIGRIIGEWALRADSQAPRSARHCIHDALGEVPEQLLRRIVLVTSELVTNSVRYAPGGLTVTLSESPTNWVVSVADSSHIVPRFEQQHALAEQGRGMVIVQRISEEVGWSKTPTGKVVWARFARDIL
ncbi:MAG: ATP-binding protein [Actinomycetota bacterium]